MDFPEKERYTIEDLLEVTRILRGENGCPWDREQTHASVRREFLEEAYEAVEAIDTGDTALLREELGDVLFQVVFHAQMETERGSFTFADVASDVTRKMIRRHPFVFGDAHADSAEDALRQWDGVKREMRQQKTAAEALASVTPAMPALMRAQKVLGKAEKAGLQPALPEEAGQRAAREALAGAEDPQAALGELLLGIVQQARRQGLDAEEALAGATRRYIADFAAKTAGDKQE